VVLEQDLGKMVCGYERHPFAHDPATTKKRRCLSNVLEVYYEAVEVAGEPAARPRESELGRHACGPYVSEAQRSSGR
jgi:hypothetical protein